MPFFTALIIFFRFFFRPSTRSLTHNQNQLQEAAQCVQDCRELVEEKAGAATDNNDNEWSKEMEAAEDAVNVAVACLVDLLDELRASSEGESEVATDAAVRRIRALRADLAELKERRPQPEE